MKHFVTLLLLFLAIASINESAFSQSSMLLNRNRPGIAHSQRTPATLGIQPGIFNQSAVEAPMFTAAEKGVTPQGTVDSESYFQDTTGNFFTLVGAADSFNVYTGPTPTDSTMFFDRGFAERISTSLTKAYLDSVQILLGIVDVPATNNIVFDIVHSRDDTNKTTGAILPGPDLHNTAIISKTVSGSTLTQGQFMTITATFNKHLLGTRDHNFWVNVDQGGMSPYDDSVIFSFDANVQGMRDIDSTIDRCNVVFQDAALKYFIEFSLAGDYHLISDATQNFYPNMVLIAYLNDGIAGVEENTLHPSAYRLAQNYPNPVVGSTDINYALPSVSQVSLKVYNALGQEIQTLVNRSQINGEHSVSFNAASLPSGLYYYTIKANGFTQTRRMMVAH